MNPEYMSNKLPSAMTDVERASIKKSLIEFPLPMPEMTKGKWVKSIGFVRSNETRIELVKEEAN